jgi:hypothetical protein
LGFSLLRRVNMPRFHFEIVDGFTIEDSVGRDCKNEEQARQVAEDIARQLVLDVGENPDRKVVVVDGKGSQVYKATTKS